jgi:hypothetical protein
LKRFLPKFSDTTDQDEPTELLDRKSIQKFLELPAFAKIAAIIPPGNQHARARVPVYSDDVHALGRVAKDSGSQGTLTTQYDQRRLGSTSIAFSRGRIG